MKKILSIFILTILIASCNQNQTDKGAYALAGIEEEMIPIARQSSESPILPMDKIEKPELINKKIIKDGRIGLRVEKLVDTKMRLDTLVKSHRGYYANESFINTDWESSYNLKVRIPYENFDKFISDIEIGYGEVQYKEIGARDVTDQFIDLETRLENKRNYLQRYNDLLKKANTVKDILEIEEKIRGLEEEIESTTGRLKYLSDLVDYSTLDLTISKQKDFKYNPERRANFLERLKQSLSKGWYGFVDFLLFVIKIWPFWIIVTLMVYFWRKYKITKKKKNTGALPPKDKVL
jgi:hypothetical protein